MNDEITINGRVEGASRAGGRGNLTIWRGKCYNMCYENTRTSSGRT